ncbi:MAG: hypothetical protein EOM51_05015 [Clostridia bacterium]|nr:hypothetical protein [Clostridia bacterium]
MRLKISAAALILILISTVGYVSYALLSAHASTQNIITAGTVKIELNDVAEGLEVMPATTAQRDVIIKNIGANDCYVRVMIIGGFESSLPVRYSSADQVVLGFDDHSWTKDSAGFWRYNFKLAPGESTSNLLTGVSFDKSMGNEYQNTIYRLSISAQAVQAANNSFDIGSGSILDVVGWPATAP